MHHVIIDIAERWTISHKEWMKHAQHIRKFISEVGLHCEGRTLGPSTFTNRVLGQTYALPRMLALAESLDDRIVRLRAAMVEAMPEKSESPIFRAISIDLPIGPSTNALYKNAGGGQKARSSEYAAWAKMAGQEIMAARGSWAKKALPMDHLYVARIRLAIDDPADVDNRQKAVIDLLKDMQITPDDRHMWHASSGRSAKVAKGRMQITVRSLPIKI